MRKAVEPQFQWIKPDGTPTQYFAELIQQLSKNTFAQPVSATDTPANGETPLYNATTGVWEFGAN